jgi:hypothetical protein
VPGDGLTVFRQSDVPELGPICMLLGRAVMVRDWGQTISLPAVPSGEHRPLTSTLADLLFSGGGDPEVDRAQERWAGSSARAKAEVSSLVLQFRERLILGRKSHSGTGEVAEVIARSRREIAREAQLALRAIHASLSASGDLSHGP